MSDHAVARIAAACRPVAESDPVALDHFDLYVMRRAADLAPFERERRRVLLEGGEATA